MQVKGEYCCLDMILRIDTACLFPLHCEVPHFFCELTGINMFMQGGGWGEGLVSFDEVDGYYTGQ